jgi:hypothetical protein
LVMSDKDFWLTVAGDLFWLWAIGTFAVPYGLGSVFVMSGRYISGRLMAVE